MRRNTPPYGSSQGPSTSANSNDASLLVAQAGLGKIAGHFDRNTFFNQGGVGSDITRFDNETYAINLFNWLAAMGPVEDLDVSNLTRFDGVNLTWSPLPSATAYDIYRNPFLIVCILKRSLTLTRSNW